MQPKGYFYNYEKTLVAIYQMQAEKDAVALFHVSSILSGILAIRKQ